MSESKSIFDRLRSILGMTGKHDKAHPAPQPTGKTNTPANITRGEAARPSKQVSQTNSLIQDVTLTPLKSENEVDLILGIDFGTSCTKVVIGDHGWQGKSYTVPIGFGHTGLERYLRPTQIKVGSKTETNLKMRLMENPDSVEIQDLAILYLAGVIRDALAWFSSERIGRYRNSNLLWSLNLGFAAKRVDDGPLAQAYKQVADFAARLGPSDVPLNITSVKKIRRSLNTNDMIRLIPKNRISLYPEIAAQLAGYVNSPYRAKGNLILIDVGAGTLDVSTMILHANSENDIVSFHVCEVGHLGAFKLLQTRISAIEKVAPGSVRKSPADYQSGTVPIPETYTDLLGVRRGKRSVIKAFEEASEDFADNSVRLAIACAIRFRILQQEAHQNRRAFDPWPGQLRFFFTGGGSRLSFYRDLFVNGRFEQELTRFTRWKESPQDRARCGQGLRLEQLPMPEDLQELPTELASDFDRLSVAHGLAYGCANLMKITASIHS